MTALLAFLAANDAPWWGLAIAGVVRGLFASEPYLYVADEAGAFRIIDISAPEQPRELSGPTRWRLAQERSTRRPAVSVAR